MNAVRISKVTDKRTGRSLHVLPPSRFGGEARRMIREAREIAEMYPGESLAAYVVVAVGKDGNFSRSLFIHKDAPFGRTAFPSLVADILRRDTVEDQIEDAFVRNGFERPPEDDPA